MRVTRKLSRPWCSFSNLKFLPLLTRDCSNFIALTFQNTGQMSQWCGVCGVMCVCACVYVHVFLCLVTCCKHQVWCPTGTSVRHMYVHSCSASGTVTRVDWPSAASVRQRVIEQQRTKGCRHEAFPKSADPGVIQSTKMPKHELSGWQPPVETPHRASMWFVCFCVKHTLRRRRGGHVSIT